MKSALLAGEALADHLGALVDQNAHAPPLLAAGPGGGDHLAGRIGQIAGRADRQRPAGQLGARGDCALVPSSRTTTGTRTPTSRTALMMPSAIRSQRTMPPKMLTRIARTLRVGKNQLEGRGHALGGRAAADVEEVGGLAALQLDQVHGRHRQACAVDHAGDVAIERDVVEIVLAGDALGRIFLVRIAQRGHLRLAEQRVGLDVELAIERHQASGCA